MRIVVNGQQAFGKAVLEALLQRGDNVVAAYCPEDQPGKPPDPVKELALARGLPVFQPASFKGQAAADALASLEPDLGIMAFVTKIVPPSFLEVPKQGTIQYHPSLLPLHRGPSSINWPIIQGETKTGLTIFWPDEGLDTGPVLLQKTVEIGPDDTLGTVYFDKLFPLGVAAMLEAVDLVKAGKAPRVAQDHSRATYESWCTTDDVGIDWSRPAAEVYNLVRGANPQPGAWTKLDGSSIQIFDAAKAGPVNEAPGTVVAVDEKGIVIAAAGGSILAKRVRAGNGGKMAAAEFARAQGIAPGARFTVRPS
jgi:methionyl-tRNA formyltransferase